MYRNIVRLVRGALCSVFVLGLVASPPSRATATRDDDPVIVTGASLPGLTGQPIGHIAAFRWNAAASAFEPIPFQIDERIDHTFDEVPGYPVVQNIYDVFNEDDGLLDADDELVFLFGDAGPEAPEASPWVAGAEATRFEVELHDPRPDAAVPTRWVYLFTGTGLPRSSTLYVTWNGLATSAVLTNAWSIGFSDRWILDSLRIEPPCGSGADFIDRFKGRAGANLLNESEQDWNVTSIYIGSIVGPVRAARYVRGAASGLNTIHHDIIYRRFWQRVVNLRVHPIAGVGIYFDLRPNAGTKVYTSLATSGLTVDGVPEFPGTTFVPWAVVRGPQGGYAALFDVPPSPFYGAKRFYYKDDAGYNDATGPLYLDEDDSAYGVQGVELRDLVGSESQTIYASFRVYPLCANTGDSGTGADLQALLDNPVQSTVSAQSAEVLPIRTLKLGRSGGDVLLEWPSVVTATAYRIYTAVSPWLPHEGWTLHAEVATTTYTDAGAAALPTPRYYSVVAVTPSGESDW